MNLTNTVDGEKNSIIPDQHNEIFNSGFDTGLVIGQIVFFVILFGFIIGIIFLIRYFIKKNRKKKFTTHTSEQPRAGITQITCQNCNSENKSDTKYCSKCGYELN